MVAKVSSLLPVTPYIDKASTFRCQPRTALVYQDEVLFDAARPVILNGIEDVVTRPDLAHRAVFLTLWPISQAHRRSSTMEISNSGGSSNRNQRSELRGSLRKPRRGRARSS